MAQAFKGKACTILHSADGREENVKPLQIYRWSPDDDRNPRH